jgi:hypothetical protein
MSKNLPAMAGPAGGLVPFMSARRRHEICDIVFENLGGTQRLEHEANRDQESYWKFMGLWSKGLPRAVANQHSADSGMESLLDRLEKGENAKIINADYTEVDDEPA